MESMLPGLLATLQSGVAPFLGLPMASAPGPASGVILGVPFDGGVIHRPGARLGPWALRSASLGVGRLPLSLHLQNGERMDYSPAAEGWVDGGNLPTLPIGVEAALQAVEQGLAPWIEVGCRTFLLGGDHLMTLGALRALAAVHGPLGLLVLDAHPDAAPAGSYFGCHHGTWLRSAIEEHLVDPGRTMVCGLRAPRFDEEELSWLHARNVRLWTPLDMKDPRQASQFQGHLDHVGRGPAYVSLDLDVIDPAFAPAVAEPVPGGLSVAEALAILEQLHRWPRPWVGADLMELAPPLPGGEDSARVGVHLALRLLARARAAVPAVSRPPEDEEDL